MVIGSLVEKRDAPEAIEETGCRKKKRKKIGLKRLGSWYHVELERELLRNNGLTFPLIKNEYIYTKMGIIVSYQKHKNRKQS